MSTVFHPDPNTDSARGNAATPIEQVFNLTPVKIKITGHGWATGDAVRIEGAGGVGVDGHAFLITVLTADTFTLDGSAGATASTNTGEASNWTTLPNATIPSDGDLVDATNCNTPVECALNFVPWASERLGRFRILNIYSAEHAAATPQNAAAWSTTAMGGATNNWQWAQNNPLVFGGGTQVPVFAVDDVVEIAITTTMRQTAGTPRPPVGVGVLNSLGAAQYVPGSAFLPPNNYDGPITLRARLRCTTGSNTVGGFMDFGIILADSAGVPSTIDFINDWQILVRHMRAN